MPGGFRALAVEAAGTAAAVVQAQGQAAQAPAMKMSTVPDSPEWQRLKTLVGNWDGTMEEGDQHMRSVVFTFVDADHHEERWTSSGSSKPGVFKFVRKK